MSRKLAAMRAAREHKRLEGEPQSAPHELPELRRRIIVIDYDFGRVVHRIDLYRSNRMDCYRALVDGRPWKQRIGWARVIEAMRKSFTRVRAP